MPSPAQTGPNAEIGSKPVKSTRSDRSKNGEYKQVKMLMPAQTGPVEQIKLVKNWSKPNWVEGRDRRA
jgi:hypothetical protein